MVVKKNAGFWIRFVAIMIDGLILGIPLYILQFVLHKSIVGYSLLDTPELENIPETSSFQDIFSATFTPDYVTYIIVIQVLSLLIGISYYGLMTSSKYQGTVGKLAVGIKVVDTSGNRISFLRSLGRYFASMLSGFLYIGYLMVGLTQEKRGLHDFIAGTRVEYKTVEITHKQVL